ncbi:MAG: tetratricopeptide repeat protein, partial [Chloroflexota bacterium]|nr:tetratricopeptide repeat protein [Chloroflexota bacterium]
ALAICEAVYGPDHPTVAIRLSNLGLVLQDLGDLQGARSNLERALAIDQAVYGPEHPAVAANLFNLGALLVESGELKEAAFLLKKAQSIYFRYLGPEHDTTVSVSTWVKGVSDMMDRDTN